MAETTPKGSNNAGVVLGWLDKGLAMLKKYGLQNIFMTILVIFIAIVVGRIAFDPEATFKKFEEAKQKAHTEAIMRRIENEPRIRENLVNLRGELNADRVYVLETHNGGNNLAGLPFIYVDLTYAEPKNALTWLENEYKNVRLSRYPWASEVYRSTYWSGRVENLEQLDPELFYRLKNEDVAFMAVMMMYGTYSPSGVIGVVYTSDDYPSDDTIQRTLMRYVNSLAPLFNNE